MTGRRQHLELGDEASGRLRTVLSLTEVSLRTRSTFIVRDVSLHLRQTELIVVSGLNGSGKTSLLRLCAGVRTPRDGTRSCRAPIGYVPAGISPLPLTPSRWLQTFPRERLTDPRLLLEELGFQGKFDRPMRELSFGNRRKLLLAELFSSNADVLIVDEIAAGLDHAGISAVKRLVKRSQERGAAVLLADQETGIDWNETRSYWMESGSLAETAERPAIIQLVGPVQNLEAMRDSARELNFRVV